MAFRISSREHNALILMVELALAKGLLSLDAIAQRMHISQGYLEEIARALKSAGLISGRQGRGGGYALAGSASRISLADILLAVDGPLELVSCQGAVECPVGHKCPSKKVWSDVQAAIDGSLKGISLASIINE